MPADPAHPADPSAWRLRALLVDLSGTLHIGSQPTRSAAEAIERLREAGILLRFVSNTSKESRTSHGRD